MFYHMIFFMLFLSIFSKTGLSATFEREPFPAALEMSSEKLHRVVSIVRDPLPIAETSSVRSNNLIADITSSGDGTIYVKCSQVPMTVSPFCREASVDFLGLRGGVHGGMASLVRGAIADFQRTLSAFITDRREIGRTEFVFTGYSTGASVASLLAIHFVKRHRDYGVQELRDNQVKIIGFETQRIGNRAFVDDFLTDIPDHNIINFWHAEDVYRHNIFYSKDWKKPVEKPVDLGMVLVSERATEFIPPPPASTLNKAARFLKIASFSTLLYMAYQNPECRIYALKLVNDSIPYVKDGIASGFSSIKTAIDIGIKEAVAYRGYVGSAFTIGILGVVGEYFTHQPTMPFMFDDSLMSQTIRKLNERHRYFTLPL